MSESPTPNGPSSYYRARRMRESPNAISGERALDHIRDLTAWLAWLGPNLPLPIQIALHAYLGAAKGDLLAYRNNLVTSNEGLVGKLIHTRYRQLLSNAGIPIEDAMQEGLISLIRAADLFDVSRKWRFSTYAMYWVRQALNRLVQKDNIIPVPEWIMRTTEDEDTTKSQKFCRQKAKAVRNVKRFGQKFGITQENPLGYSLTDNLIDKQTKRLYEEVDAEIDLDELLSNLAIIPRRAVELYYLEGLTLDETSNALVIEGLSDRVVTRERMRQIIYNSMEILKEKVERR